MNFFFFLIFESMPKVKPHLNVPYYSSILKGNWAVGEVVHKAFRYEERLLELCLQSQNHRRGHFVAHSIFRGVLEGGPSFFVLA